MSEVLNILGLKPSALSTDYVENKKQFHLFRLLTEQRHPETWNLSFVLDSGSPLAGLEMLFAVDRDISSTLRKFESDPALLAQAAEAVAAAVADHRRIYVYGCGATGRLAKQMESTFWRPFWRRVKNHRCWEKLRPLVGEAIDDSLVGEMTGGDRALVSSLEGFEDLQLIGRLQLQDHGIGRGDVVICVTEGGETSSVIGTVLAAADQYGPLNEENLTEARRRLYFICNNPREVLLPLDRSAAVLDHPAITHIDLTTGPQAITGSTRMQATTIETFVVGVILEQALARILGSRLDPGELRELGFDPEITISKRLAQFETLRQSVASSAGHLAPFTDLEAGTYRNRRFSTYLADQALITVFIDGTERSPTFRLYPLDKVEDAERRCWVQVWTTAPDLRSAWHKFLGRPFHGLDPKMFEPAFQNGVQDPYLRDAALRSLANAGNDQEFSYDFSFSEDNVARCGPNRGDLGVLVLMENEIGLLADPTSQARQFIALFQSRGAAVAVLTISANSRREAIRHSVTNLLKQGNVWAPLLLDDIADPLTVNAQVALKMLLNAHSTAIMASLGRVVGNTMTSVSPSNLKLIGRATHLVLSHVNDVCAQPEWISRHGVLPQLTFSEVNAVLFDAIDFVKLRNMGQTAEVALSIIRLVEALDRGTAVSWDEARQILEHEGLAPYLVRRNPSLAKALGSQRSADR